MLSSLQMCYMHLLNATPRTYTFTVGRRSAGRRAAVLLPGRVAQVPLPHLLRRRPHQPRPVGLQHRGQARMW